eukprot:scaffold77253_cov25-Prasinocladus_malaysianus.AAC.1
MFGRCKVWSLQGKSDDVGEPESQLEVVYLDHCGEGGVERGAADCLVALDLPAGHHIPLPDPAQTPTKIHIDGSAAELA